MTLTAAEEAELTPEKRVERALRELGIREPAIALLGDTATAPAAAAAVGCPLGAIVKSLIFLAQDQPVLVLAPGDRQVSDARLAALLGVSRKRIKLADADTAFDLTGFRVGGIPPVGHRRPLPVYMDAGLQRFPIVWAAAGSPSSVFPVAPAELIRITGAAVVETCRVPEETVAE